MNKPYFYNMTDDMNGIYPMPNFEKWKEYDKYLRIKYGRKWMHACGIPCPPRPEYDYIDKYGVLREKYHN